ncbi:argonaute-like protein [Gloeophyllum trabeum ATCC 11539]|uniref:Argonaute-like protein n=1 Tax=Gloeophyllum trabeum (strain ATCC 11539 / FP-39264 / Madison 617) TaxID=670483 RepID=S7PW75_GLOTA|nr:argonaute-like protein [Gloeophyllum trabeum ATCC 11539]EPQ51876.1 argonaute-like protein [Gloeophyllum trabeum ATCC 11539]
MSSRGDRGRGRAGGRGGSRGGAPSDRSSQTSEVRGRGGYRGGPPSTGSYDRGGGRGGGERGYGDRGGRGGDRGFRGDRGGRGGFRGRGGPSERGGIFGGPAPIDARLQGNVQQTHINSLRSIALGPGDLPVRPGLGTVGRQITLRANFFPVRLPKIPLQEYDVDLRPGGNSIARRLKRRIWQLAEQTAQWQAAGMTGTVAHDHSSKLISARQLPQPLVIQVNYTEEDEDAARGPGKEYTLTFNYVQQIDTSNLVSYINGERQFRNYDPMPVISALNLILAAYPNRSVGGGVMVGRNRYFHPSATEPPLPLGGGLEAWKGFYSSVRPAFKQLMVNVNVCHTAFYTAGNLADKMIEYQNASWGARVTAFVKGVRIKTTHLGYTKSVRGVARFTARQYTFDCPELGGNVTCEVYYQRKYAITLRHANDLPLVDVGGPQSKRKNYLPAELCTILPNQPFRGKLTDEHTANMILAACKPPNINAQSIVGRGLNELGFAQTPAPLSTFGVSIGNEMAVVPGRILPPPYIEYGQGRPSVDQRASWNLRNVKFARGAKLEKWAVLLIKDGNHRDEFRDVNDPDLRSVVDGFADMCRKSGMVVENQPPVYAAAQLPPKNSDTPLRPQAIKTIQTVLRSLKVKPTIVLIVLSNGDKHIYSGLKHLCDVYLDVATVCVQSSKFRKAQLQYYANVALKVNMKLGGVNHTVNSETGMRFLKQEPTMLVGMDVTHPGFGSVLGTPSIAAVVASVESMFGQFPCSLRIQESRKEMITDLESMMTERLESFKKRNNRLPSRVLVYRDGVSEGQFAIVVNDELPKIKEAFKKLSTPQNPYKPKLTIVICGKRHHTRFYPTEAENADDKGNPVPGTVVDQGVTAVYDFDFFLQAHGGLQGTTRPTHYYVVYDEIGFSADQLQGLTNEVSYMFARATKAVSLVSPAYYADLACERGRCYLHKLLQGISDGGTTSAGGNHDRLEEDAAVMREAQTLWHGGVRGTLGETMFYL